MTGLKLLLSFTAACFGWTGAVAQAADDDVMKNIINNPAVNQYQVYGPQTHAQIKDPIVQGGAALEINVDGQHPNPYDVAAQMPISGAIKAGDTLVAAIWIRTVSTANGGQGQAVLRLQLSSDPYTEIAQKPVALTPTWELYTLQTVASTAFARDTTSLGIQIGHVDQTVDIGPAFILNLGPKATPAQ